MHGFM